ncbi:CD63 antigen [Leptinotarsa decemlineata]|uniref:CD63 antigen n=1 Tax=Leptinotarsa decemlineata TaxID=7539 RepID=UPI000C25492C|nr:CD63 antigen-like [Leptinotarsa decemlineata]
MVSSGMSCVKYLLFAFNLLFAISGIAILTVGVIVHVVYSHYSNFVYSSYQSTPLVLIGVGVVIFIITFFGCCGAVKENHCLVITYSVLLIVILMLELITGIVGYVKRSDVEMMLENKLNSTMNEYYINEDIKNTWDIAQHEAECCGMNGPTDWYRVTGNDSLPHTCCPDTQDDGSCTMKTSNHYTASCIDKLKFAFKKYGAIIGGVGIGIAALQLIGVMFACCLARSIRKEYEIV